MSSNQKNIETAISIFNSPGNKISLFKVCQAHNAPYTTVKARLEGRTDRKSFNQSLQLLSPKQEAILEAHIIYLAHLNCCPNGKKVRILAQKILSKFVVNPPLPSKTWLDNFIKRSPYLIKKSTGQLDMPSIRESGEQLIHLFFDLFLYYQNKFDVESKDIWNLDEAGFKIDETSGKIEVMAPRNTHNTITHESSELVTVLEVISGDGEVGKPLFIYQRNSLMEAWFPEFQDTKVNIATSPTPFINSEIFCEWFQNYFPTGTPGKWRILLLDGHISHTRKEVIEYALSKHIIPLYYPSHMTNILQPLDRSCFGVAKQMYRHNMSYSFADGLSPTKQLFFNNYMSLREHAYSSKVIKGGYSKTGLIPLNKSVAISAFNDQMNINMVTHIPEVNSPNNLSLQTNKNSENDPSYPFTRHAKRQAILREDKSVLVARLEIEQEKVEGLQAENAVLEKRMKRMKNQIMELKRQKNTKRPRISNFNKK